MKKILLVSSQGGHFAELKKIKRTKNYKYIVVSESKSKKENLDYTLYPGTRNNLFKYIFIFIYNFFKTFGILVRERPDFIITTGAHSCVPFIYLSKLFKSKTIYIESFAKVSKKSLTYKLIKYAVDEVIIQHKELDYPNAYYYGGIY